MAHAGEICSKEELYKNAYLAPSGQAVSATLEPNKSRATRSGTEAQETAIPRQRRVSKTSGYADTVDTVLWRLREAIEPDMDDPIFILTHRGQGVVLYLHPFE